MKVLIAGGTGFLGRHVTEALRAAGHQVILLARGTRASAEGEGVETIRADVSAGELPLESLRGCDAIVNLIGIKREQGTQTFRRVHVESTRHLIDAAKALGIRRFIQISVVCSRPDPSSAYHDTKWQAEERVRAGGLDVTILKPGVIYGPGDDMVTHLVKMIRFVPVFPVVGGGTSILQPVHARDVAGAVGGALANEASIGKSYDVVGPERMTLRQVVRTVAEGTGLGLWIVSTPIWFQRFGVRLMNALFRNPLSTPAQLRMLIDGLYGDPGPALADLGVEPSPFTPEVIRELEPAIPSLFGFSLRLVDRRDHAAWLEARQGEFTRALLLIPMAIGLLLALTLWKTNVWYRMSVFYAVMVPLTLAGLRIGWKDLFAPKPRHLAIGVLGAVVLELLGKVAFPVLAAIVPDFRSQVAQVNSWGGLLPPWAAFALLIPIILGEEIVWRAGVLLPLAAKLGPWWGCLLGALAFGAAHLGFGLPLMTIAAVGCGVFWNAMVIKTRSLIPSLICHLLWDLTALFLLPY